MHPDRKSRPQVLLVSRAIIVNGSGDILLIQRSFGDRWGAGRWEFPGGKLDQGQDVSNALEREVLEETSLLVTPISRTGCFESNLIAEGKYKGMTYINLTGICKLEGGKLKLSDEHQDYKWVTEEDALDYPLTEPTRKALIVLQQELKTFVNSHTNL